MARPPTNPQATLRPQDLVVLLRLTLLGPQEVTPSYAELAAELGLTASETHACVERCVAAGLARKDERGRPRALLAAVRPFILHGARYCFPASRGGMTRGVPTAHAAEPLCTMIQASHQEPPPVWPDPDGAVRGETLHPLYPSVPQAARRLPALHALLALFDALRAGSARERTLAQRLLEQRWSEADSA